MKFRNTALCLVAAALLISLSACGGDKANESTSPESSAPAQETIEPMEPPISNTNDPTSEGETETTDPSEQEQEISSDRAKLAVLSDTVDWIVAMTEEELANLKYDDVVAYIGCDPSTLQESDEDVQIYQWKADGTEDDILKVTFKLTDGNWVYLDSALYI